MEEHKQVFNGAAGYIDGKVMSSVQAVVNGYNYVTGCTSYDLARHIAYTLPINGFLTQIMYHPSENLKLSDAALGSVLSFVMVAKLVDLANTAETHQRNRGDILDDPTAIKVCRCIGYGLGGIGGAIGLSGGLNSGDYMAVAEVFATMSSVVFVLECDSPKGGKNILARGLEKIVALTSPNKA